MLCCRSVCAFGGLVYLADCSSLSLSLFVSVPLSFFSNASSPSLAADDPIAYKSGGSGESGAGVPASLASGSGKPV